MNRGPVPVRPLPKREPVYRGAPFYDMTWKYAEFGAETAWSQEWGFSVRNGDLPIRLGHAPWMLV